MMNTCAEKARAEAQPCKDDKHRQKARDLPLDLKIVSLPPNVSRLSSPYSFPWHTEGGNSSVSSHVPRKIPITWLTRLALSWQRG